MAVTKRKRAKKVSKGIHGATKHPLTEIEKVLAGKGALRRTPYPDCTPWRGVAEANPPYFDPAQRELNRQLYPHLFVGKR